MNKQWIYRNARPLEKSLYDYYFEEGSKEDVLNILKAYQNPDGGFGHGLESDCHNPNSSPIQTWAATCIIRDLDISSHEIIDGILKYLEKTPEQKQGHYFFAVTSNRYFPHAPWWDYSEEANLDFNPTASLQGFILRYGQDTPLYKIALIKSTEIVDYVISHGSQEMHELSCIIELMEAIDKAGLKDLFRFKTFQEKVIESVHKLIEKDPDKWSDYTCTPLKYIHSKESLFYKGFETLTEKNLDYLLSQMHPDGYWDINWAWNQYSESFIIARQWWRGVLTVNNLKILNAFKKV